MIYIVAHKAFEMPKIVTEGGYIPIFVGGGAKNMLIRLIVCQMTRVMIIYHSKTLLFANLLHCIGCGKMTKRAII